MRKPKFAGWIALALGLAAFFWIRGQNYDDGIPWFLRKNHEASARVWSGLFSPRRSPPHLGAPPGTEPRVNGDLGIKTPIDRREWRLKVYVEDRLMQTFNSLNFKWLPRSESATEFYCIEGWRTQFSYSGVRFSDFMKFNGIPSTYRYIGLETPDGGYYVSIDMESMLHPQTLLADQMNERPLALENGFPLRLVIPIKYGIKSLKRIGVIRFSNQRLPDYWAERGYDWYSGL